MAKPTFHIEDNPSIGKFRYLVYLFSYLLIFISDWAISVSCSWMARW